MKGQVFKFFMLVLGFCYNTRYHHQILKASQRNYSGIPVIPPQMGQRNFAGYYIGVAILTGWVKFHDWCISIKILKEPQSFQEAKRKKSLRAELKTFVFVCLISCKTGQSPHSGGEQVGSPPAATH